MKKNPYKEDEQLSLSFVEPLWEKVHAATTDKFGWPKDAVAVSKLPKVKINGVWRRIIDVAYEGANNFFKDDFFPKFPDELYLTLEDADETVLIRNLSSFLKKYPNGNFKNIEYTIFSPSRKEVAMKGDVVFSNAK